MADGESGGRSGLFIPSKSHLKNGRGTAQIQDASISFPERKKKNSIHQQQHPARCVCVWGRCSHTLQSCASFQDSCTVPTSPAPRPDFIPCQGTWPVDFVREAALSIRQPGPPLANHQLELPSAAPDGPAGTSEPSLRQAWAIGPISILSRLFFPCSRCDNETSESRQVRGTREKHQCLGGGLY